MRKKTKKQKDKEKEAEKDREKSMLKLTLEIVVKENTQLKSILEDMKINVAENKHQLQDTIKKITDKDTAVAMLSTQIDQLKQKFNEMQSKQKLISINNIYGSEETFPFKNTETANTTSPHFLSKNFNNNKKNLEENNLEEQKEKQREENIKKMKGFLDTQQEIFGTIMGLKRDVNYLKEKINENRCNKIFYQYNLNIENVLKENEIDKIENFFNKGDNDDNGRNLFYLVGNDGGVYKIKKRDDLKKNDFLDKIEMNFNQIFNNEIFDTREKIETINKSCYDNNNYIGESEINDYLKKIRQNNEGNNSNEINNNKVVNNYLNDIMKESFIL